MSFQNLLVEIKNKIAYFTLNRPDKLNALNWQTMQELHQALTAVKDDPNVGGVILTGAGEKAFAAGADIGELAQLTPIGAKTFAEKGQELLNFIEHFPKPIIAAINGFCLGGGNELAMACHIRVASEKAKFGQPEVGLGIICGYGGSQRLPRLIGKGRAIEMLITGNPIDATEAHRIGLANYVVPAGQLIPKCEEILQAVFKKGPVAVMHSLEAVTHGMEMTLGEGLQLEANLFGLCFATEDMQEGTKAFLEKRAANFQGK
ncbi:MAG: enoyl-CoA hydratase-related protein [candidate division KSB1 bacterium]|nr:enoyl-CoA hydratase-related protein [candidate division KSB1 bacterium]MDZ7312917.1 enoyl-CoA hydratase-related protein [candidate division KSB1 bacterium]